MVEIAVGEDQHVLTAFGAGDQGLGCLFGAALGLAPALLTLVMIEDMPPEAGHGTPVFGRQLEPVGEMRRRQGRLDEQGVRHDLATGGDGGRGLLGAGAGRGVDGTGTLGRGEEFGGRGLAGAQAADLVSGPPVAVLVRGQVAFA